MHKPESSARDDDSAVPCDAHRNRRQRCDTDSCEEERPLSTWQFTGTLRTYQRDILATLTPGPDHPLHIVAPPGAGKTLVGLMLAMRSGWKAVALAPTTTIRHQWALTATKLSRAAAAYAPVPDDEPQATISEDPELVGDFTALTYQALSTVRSTDAVADLAREQWIDDLVDAGRSVQAADEWLKDLKSSNSAAYRSGISRRASKIRTTLTAQDPKLVERVLHPHAIAAIDRIVQAGVRTVILDECHHLLDHWALVIGLLLARIRASGREPIVIGLTATLPSVDDGRAFDTYSGLFGDVDFEVPTPAVVREGNLAPYRDLVWFTEPADDEITFLTSHDRQLRRFLKAVFAGGEGLDFLLESIGFIGIDGEQPTGIDAQLEADYAFTESAAQVLIHTHGDHPAALTLPRLIGNRRPSIDSAIRVCARFALEKILPDASRADEWHAMRRTLKDFGYYLTDRGIRAGRNPVDTVMAQSHAKNDAAVDIVHHELASADGQHVRAVIVCDFATEGNRRGRSTGPVASAVECFARVCADATTAGLHPILLTSQHLHVASADAQWIIPALEELSGLRLAVDSGDENEPEQADHLVTRVKVESSSPSAAVLVRAVSTLMEQGTVRLLVGTRGLLGEGWDCPAVNTLIDLTAVAISAATQQLRGRTLRLDPQWPGKVAHNWGVICVMPPRISLDSDAEISRMNRRHEQLWGLDVTLPIGHAPQASDYLQVSDRPHPGNQPQPANTLLSGQFPQIVTGIDHSLTLTGQARLRALLEGDRRATINQLNDQTLQLIASRAATYEQWGIGQPYSGDTSHDTAVSAGKNPTFYSSPTLWTAVALLSGLCALLAGIIWPMLVMWGTHPVRILIALAFMVVLLGIAGAWRLPVEIWRMLRGRSHPARVYAGATVAVSRGLVASERGQRLVSLDEVQVRPYGAVTVGTQAMPAGYVVSLPDVPDASARTIIDAVSEVFAPIETPRFLLRVTFQGDSQRPSTLLLRMVSWIAQRISPSALYVQIPREVGRRKAGAKEFARAWAELIGPCQLVEVSGAEAMRPLAQARLASRNNQTHSRVRTVWA